MILTCLLLASCQKITFDSLDTMPKEFGKCLESHHSFNYLNFINQSSSDSMQFSILLDIDNNGDNDLLNPSNIITFQQVEDVKRQLLTANQIYREVLYLKPPLAQQRYQQAKFINVSFIADKKPYGRAYDEVSGETSYKGHDCFIRMAMSNKVYAHKSNTPAHELFHLYHNSQTMFKQGWLTEGLARWSESLFEQGVGDGADIPLPQTRYELNEIMNQRYAASKMWIRLFKLVDGVDTFNLPNAIQKQVYTSGRAVVADNRAYGTQFISTIYDELSKESDHVSEIKGWDRYAWKEKDQKDPALNPYIWNAVKRAVAKSIPYEQQSEELRRCMEIEL